jgi:hypothetical protein
MKELFLAGPWRCGMPRKRAKISQLVFHPRAPVLITESAEEFEYLVRQLDQDIKPRGIIEETFVRRIAQLIWEIRRYERVKSTIINTAFPDALRHLLDQLSLDSEESQELTERWFTEPAAKKEVAERLEQIELDESAIEAEAVRRSAKDLEPVERMLCSLESRLKNALAFIAEYRGVAAKLGGSPNRMIESGGIVRLPAKSSAG